MAGQEPAIQWAPIQCERCEVTSGFVYILANKRNGTLYTGVTNDMPRRMRAHREGYGSEFVRKYNVTLLMWFEEHPMYVNAIQRETNIKRWKRAWKLALIEKTNPNWDDLLEQWYWWD